MDVLASRLLLCPTDPARSRHFYGELLGLAVAREFGPLEDPGVVYFAGGNFIEVSGRAAQPPNGGMRIWLQVRDVAAEHERLVAVGVAISRPPKLEPWGLIEMWIEDPDGVPIVLIEVPPEHPLRRDQGDRDRASAASSSAGPDHEFSDGCELRRGDLGEVITRAGGARSLRGRTFVDGYLFFDSVTPETRSALFELVEDELLRLAAVTVSGSVAAFAAYTAPDIRAAYALVEAVAGAIGRPSARLLAVSGQRAVSLTAPGTVAFEGERAVALALLHVPLSRAEEVAQIAGQMVGARAAVVLGGAATVLVEVDGATLDELEPRLAAVLAVAGDAKSDVLVTTTELGAGWGNAQE